MQTMWEPAPLGHKYGGALLTSSQPNPSAASAAVTPAAGPSTAHAGHTAPVWSPHHPFFWLAGIAAVSVGLAAASTTARIGPIKATVHAGKD